MKSQNKYVNWTAFVIDFIILIPTPVALVKQWIITNLLQENIFFQHQHDFHGKSSIHPELWV